MQDYREPPFNPVPPVVWLLILPLVGVELVLSAAEQGMIGGAAGIGWRQDGIMRFGLSPQLLGRLGVDAHWRPAGLLPFVTYPFLHGGGFHMMMTAALGLGLGKFISEVFGPPAIVALFFVGALAGGLTYSLVPGQTMILFGAMPADYGLIGALTFIKWAELGLAQVNRSRAFGFVAASLAFQLVVWLIYRGDLSWLANLGGFLGGFLLSFIVVPGGPRRILAQVRQR